MAARRTAVRRGSTRKGKGQKTKTKSKKTLGKAAALPGQLWSLWLLHVLKEGSCWLYVALLLTHVLCLRITECLRLQSRDFSFKTNSVLVGPLKKQAAVRKPLLPEVKQVLKFLKEKGITRKRTTRKGARGEVTWIDRWRWPDQGQLFPTSRDDSYGTCRSKDTACKAVSRLRKTFHEPVESSIRTHSGRHRMVNDLKSAGIPDEVGMAFARIKDRKTYEGYGKFSEDQKHTVIKKNKALRDTVASLFPKGHGVIAKASKRGRN